MKIVCAILFLICGMLYTTLTTQWKIDLSTPGFSMNSPKQMVLNDFHSPTKNLKTQ